MDEAERLVAFLNTQGYTYVLRMPDGSFCGVAPQLFTCGLFVGLTADRYARRYCYESKQAAVSALLAWDGCGDPPGPWIKEKPSDRLGPGASSDG